MSVPIAFQQGFWDTYRANMVAEIAPIKRPLAATGRGRFLPYFFKQGA